MTVFLHHIKTKLLTFKNKLNKIGLGLLGAGLFIHTSAYAINETQTQNFARLMSVSANQQNIGQIAGLIDDNAVISLTRQNKTTTLDKNAYLQLLQKGWAESKGYHYHIQVNDVVISGDQAKAQVIITETWTNKDGKKVTLKSNSRATLVQSGNNAILLRMVSQVSVN